ncbi:uncharacterized protein ACR2FA_002192 [Aphomia sociella]
MLPHQVPSHPSRDTCTYPNNNVLPANIPFIINMDMEEVRYWVYTQRAPCLLKYDCMNRNSINTYKKPISIYSIEEDQPSPIKKKRRLSLLDDGSASIEKHQNLYFEVSQVKNQQIVKSCKSDTSNIDFNIKNSPVQKRRRQSKQQKSSGTTLHKKNKVITSTPKPNVNLRRSRRQQSLNNKNLSHLDSSFEVLNNDTKLSNAFTEDNPHDKSNELEIFGAGDQNASKDIEKLIKRPIPNNHYEDLSDVSGFTANYIRSTKLHSSKTPIRSKNKRNFMKESHCSNLKNNTKTIICVNKSVNTGMPNTSALNCSTDSSQNVINLVTVKDNAKSTRVNKSSSLLKFMDSRNSRGDTLLEKYDTSNAHTTNLKKSFQSVDSGTSRYPKRNRNNSTKVTVPKTIKINNSTRNSLDKRRKTIKNCVQYKKSDLKENPEEIVISKTRSGKSIGLTIKQPENSVLVVSNSVDQSSSVVSMNVANPAHSGKLQNGSRTNKRTSPRNMGRVKIHGNNSTSLQRVSLRDKSGFAACFSDSDEGSEPLKQKKFFC